MNINNCDILIENGRLRLIYDMPGFNFPMTLIHAYSNHELNEKAMKIFEPKEWIRYLAEQSDGKTTSQDILCLQIFIRVIRRIIWLF